MLEDRKIYKRTVKMLLLSLGDLIHPVVHVIVNNNNLLQLKTVLPDPLPIEEWPVSTIRDPLSASTSLSGMLFEIIVSSKSSSTLLRF